MPNRKFHEWVNRKLLGFNGSQVHANMDLPAKYYGERHRILYHNPKNLVEFLIPALLACKSVEEIPQNIATALLHTTVDTTISALKKNNPWMKLALKLLKVI